MMENNERPFRVAIIDNDEMEIDELILILKTYPDLQIVGTSKIGAMGKRLILNKKPDLLFLDIQLPDTDGVTLLDSISDSIDWKMQVVFFTTRNISYMLQAVRKSIFDCLLKPVDKKELEYIVNRFYKERAKKENKTPDFSQALYPLMPYNKVILITSNSIKRVVRVNEVVFFSYHSTNKQWKAHMVNGSSINIKKNITAKDILNCDEAFRRTNQSFIVNIYYLQTIKNSECRFVPPFDTIEIPLSKAEKKHLEENLVVL